MYTGPGLVRKWGRNSLKMGNESEGPGIKMLGFDVVEAKWLELEVQGVRMGRQSHTEPKCGQTSRMKLPSPRFLWHSSLEEYQVRTWIWNSHFKPKCSSGSGDVLWLLEGKPSWDCDIWWYMQRVRTSEDYNIDQKQQHCEWESEEKIKPVLLRFSITECTKLRDTYRNKEAAMKITT